MLVKREKSVDKGKTFAALMTDLSKAFDCLPHDLIIAKLNAFVCSFSSARLIHSYSYLSDRKQRTKINSTYSSCEEILFGISQSSVLGLFIFNIFIWDLFSIMSE